jgi:hypothetical protein
MVCLPSTAEPGGRDAALYVRQGCLTPRGAGILPAGEPGISARWDKRRWQAKASNIFHGLLACAAEPGGRDAALYVRQGCLTPRGGRQLGLH